MRDGTVKAEQVAPTGLGSVAPTAALTDGIITGTTVAMQYKLSSATNYTAVTGTSITGLVAGTYDVRYAAKTGYNAGTDATVTVGAYVSPITVTSSLVKTTHGSAASLGADQVTILQFNGDTNVAADGSITVTFADGTQTVAKTVAVSAGDTNSIVAGKIIAAFATGLTGVTATQENNIAEFTENSPAANNNNIIITLAPGSVTGIDDEGGSLIMIRGSAASTGAAEVNTLTVTAATVNVNGNITVTFADGTQTVAKTVAVSAGDNASTVATKINDAFATGLTGVTATAVGNTVVFTANTPAIDKNVTVLISAL